jgi:carbon monoxide dehydrogenase subunit G
MRYRKTIDTPLSPAETFAYVADFGNAAAWDPGRVSSRRVDSGPLQVGSSFAIVADVRGKHHDFVYAITALDAPSRVVIEGDGPKATSRDEVTFAAIAGGGTRLTYDVDLRLKGALRAFEPFMGRYTRAMGDAALAGLQDALAQRAAAAPAATPAS